MSAPRHSRRSGFTLIELLVAITIMAVVAVLGWRGLDGIVRARVSLNRDLEQSRGLQLAISQMQNDCGRIASAAAIGNRTPLAAEDGSLTLIRDVQLENQPSMLQVVSYRLTDGVLSRRESIPTRDLVELEAAWSNIGSSELGPKPLALYTGLVSMSMRLWMLGATNWVGTGAGAVSGAVQGGMPIATKGVEVSLQPVDAKAPLVKVFLLGAG